jgi:hypothetical protein
VLSGTVHRRAFTVSSFRGVFPSKTGGRSSVPGLSIGEDRPRLPERVDASVVLPQLPPSLEHPSRAERLDLTTSRRSLVHPRLARTSSAFAVNH